MAKKSPKLNAKPTKLVVNVTKKGPSRFIVEGAAFNEIIERLELSAKKITIDIDYALRCAALHHAHHGDTRALNRIFQATKTIVHKNTVALWLKENTATTYDVKQDLFVHSDVKMKHIKEDINAYEEHVDKAKAYYDLAKPDADPFKGFDLDAVINAAIKRALKMHDAKEQGFIEIKGEERTLTQDERDAIKVDMGTLSALKRLVAGDSSTVLH